MSVVSLMNALQSALEDGGHVRPEGNVVGDRRQAVVEDHLCARLSCTFYQVHREDAHVDHVVVVGVDSDVGAKLLFEELLL
eukprot:983745-Heterocapsa_arctica.AAC.1